MSVLSFPRVHFTGLVSWDPGLANNDARAFDPDRVDVVLQDGVTHATFRQWLIDNDLTGWNYTGTHDATFVPGRTAVTGGVLGPSATVVTSDPLVGRPVRMSGKLVDLDPRAVWNSQIFWDTLGVGGTDLGLTARRLRPMHSRWINFSRNLGDLPIAGGAGVVWQTCVPTDGLEFANPAGSPLLAALAAAVAAGDAAGLMVRFATYRTLYYQNGLLNDTPQQPRTADDLRPLYAAGENFSNPAYSVVTGTIGVWRAGEAVSAPAGRYLVPAAGGPAGLGPAVAEADPGRGVLSLDLSATVPEADPDLTKADFGPLWVVAVADDGGVTEVGRVPSADYARPAYEARGGIVDLPLPDRAAAAVAAGRLAVLVERGGQTVAALAERPLAAYADERDVYLDHGAGRSVVATVRWKGGAPPGGTRLVVAKYDSALNLVAGRPEVLDVGADGEAAVPLPAAAAGCENFALIPVAAGEPVPTPPDRLDVMTAGYVSARTLPADDYLDATPDERLTWDLVYPTVLRVYDLLNPVMARPGIDLSLGDRAAVEGLARSGALEAVTAADAREGRGYMPVTRDLSAGKRRLLVRWCRRLQQVGG